MSWFYENGHWSFFFLTILLGGGAAYMTGRSIASAWKATRLLAVYCCLRACAVRFLHFALFDATLLSTKGFLIDLTVMLAIGFLGFRLTRVRQMVTQYRWQYERTGLFWWRERTSA